jgi:hypothetical protein
MRYELTDEEWTAIKRRALGPTSHHGPIVATKLTCD